MGDAAEALASYLDELARLRRRVDRARRQQAGVRCAAVHRSGAVEVVVDGAGLLVSVDVATDWPNRLAAAALADAVTAAFDEAREQASESRSRQYANLDPDEPADERGPTPIGHDTGDPLATLRELASRVSAQAARVDAALAATQEEVVGAAAAGRVRATVTGAGELVELSIEDPFGTDVRITDLGGSIQEAIGGAQQEAVRRQRHLQQVLDESGRP